MLNKIHVGNSYRVSIYKPYFKGYELFDQKVKINLVNVW